MNRHDYPAVTRACWWASGVDPSLIHHAHCSTSEQVRFAAFGMLVWLATVVALVGGFMAAGQVFMPTTEGPAGVILRWLISLPFAVFFALFTLNLLRLSVGLAGRRSDAVPLFSFEVLRPVSILLVTGVLATAIAAPIQVAVTSSDVAAKALVDYQTRTLATARRADFLPFPEFGAAGAASRLSQSTVRKPAEGFFRKVALAYETNQQLCWALLIAVWMLLAVPPVVRLFGDRGPYDFLVAHQNRAILASVGIEPAAYTLHAPDGRAERVDAYHSPRAVFRECLNGVLRHRRQDFDELQHQSLQRPFGIHPSPTGIARKRPVPVRVEFASARRTIDTLEGPVVADEGDAIVTSESGASWPVARFVFLERYEPMPPTTAGSSGAYQARALLVRVVQLEYPVSVLVSGGRSRLEGTHGDWLVDYGNGTLGIVNAEVFRDTYELLADDQPGGSQTPLHG